MFRQDNFRMIAILAFIAQVVSMVILFISIWNNISMNQNVTMSNFIYLLLVFVILFGSTVFAIYLFQISEHHYHHKDESHIETIEEKSDDKESAEQSIDTFIAPFEVDIDQLAEDIVPKIDLKETIENYAERILKNIAKQFEIVQGVIYLKDDTSQQFDPVALYAWASEKEPASFKTGDGLTGQTAKNKTIMIVENIPEGYFRILSGLGDGFPRSLMIVPLLLNKETIGIIELAAFKRFDKEIEWTFKNLAKIIGNSFVTKMKAHLEKK